MAKKTKIINDDNLPLLFFVTKGWNVEYLAYSYTHEHGNAIEIACARGLNYFGEEHDFHLTTMHIVDAISCM